MNLMLTLFISAVCVVWINVVVSADKPCAARYIPGQSVVCVSNETYNDEIERDLLMLGQYCCVTSSKEGLRFNKVFGLFTRCKDVCSCATVMRLYPEEVFQRIEGFGGSVTDAAGYNWIKLPKKLRRALIDSYFGPKGLEYNMARTPIGGSDFSTRPYTLDDYPECDPDLCHFSLELEDYAYKIPMLRAAYQASGCKLEVIASTWSPPAWMKTNNDISGRGFLKKEYYQTYADYHRKFIDSYCEEGIPIWAVTTTNEPFNTITGCVNFNSLAWMPADQGKWIAENLGPTLVDCEQDVKIICADDQLFSLPIFFNMIAQEEPNALNYIDGIGVHWYANSVTPASLFRYVTYRHPDKFIISTEACEGWRTNDVILGSWDRAINYISDIIRDLTYELVGWIDWNLCLDPCGGPNWVNNFVDAPVIVCAEQREFLKQPTYYAMGHFSKFIPRGSYRINVEVKNANGLEYVAFRTPAENVVVVLHNKNCDLLEVAIMIGSMETTFCLDPYSISTVEFPFTCSYFCVPPGSVRPAPKNRNSGRFQPTQYQPTTTGCSYESDLTF